MGRRDGHVGVAMSCGRCACVGLVGMARTLEMAFSGSCVLVAAGPSGVITGNVSGPCMSGFYYVTALPKTNLYLLVIENYRVFSKSLFYDFNCRMSRR